MITGHHRVLVPAHPAEVFDVVVGLAGSGAQVVAVDQRHRSFTYDLDAGDGRARFTWDVRHAPGSTSGALVVVRWVLPAAVARRRRRLLWHHRARRLRTRAVPRSIASLAAHVADGRRTPPVGTPTNPRAWRLS